MQEKLEHKDEGDKRKGYAPPGQGWGCGCGRQGASRAGVPYARDAGVRPCCSSTRGTKTLLLIESSSVLPTERSFATAVVWVRYVTAAAPAYGYPGDARGGVPPCRSQSLGGAGPRASLYAVAPTEEHLELGVEPSCSGRGAVIGRGGQKEAVRPCPRTRQPLLPYYFTPPGTR
ncbi:hypothetical protein COCON_G00215480 [Conger conger]|uniref:Uncharacterized protein n=1 Tax=Conger conger TaxID=82655 RepID=A0A9Q1CXW8_CONCO|nr:hypothetical protein COCON_G00215480 [Conger conger]